MLARERKTKSPFRFGEKHTEAKASYAFLMRKEEIQKGERGLLARTSPSFAAFPKDAQGFKRAVVLCGFKGLAAKMT